MGWVLTMTFGAMTLTITTIMGFSEEPGPSKKPTCIAAETVQRSRRSLRPHPAWVAPKDLEHARLRSDTLKSAGNARLMAVAVDIDQEDVLA